MNVCRETCFSLLQFMISSYFLACQMLDFVKSEKSIYSLATQDQRPLGGLLSMFAIEGEKLILKEQKSWPIPFNKHFLSIPSVLLSCVKCKGREKTWFLGSRGPKIVEKKTSLSVSDAGVKASVPLEGKIKQSGS